MKKYKIQITDHALSDMENIYNYIAEQLQAPDTAMEQYNTIADAVETLDMFPERIKLMDIRKEYALELRKMTVDNYSIFFHIKEDHVIVTNILYSGSDISKRLHDL